MHLDPVTLFVITVTVDGMLGLLLLFAWMQNASIGAVAWWGAAHLLRGAAVFAFGLRGQAPDALALDAATMLLLTTFGLTWCGARVFAGRQPQWALLFGGAALWFAASRIPSLAPDLRMLVASSIIAGYTWLAAFEFWRGRGEPLVSRWPVIVLLAVHGAMYLLHTPIAALLPWLPTPEVFASAWMIVLSFEALLFTIAIAFILLAMAKERTELLHKTAAMIDPLTGIANRRAFLQQATDDMRRGAASGPIAVLLMDLDRFKSINDGFGHALGDEVLRIFAATVGAHIRSEDLFGRLGGEEFALLLRGADRARALAAAERIRAGFQAAAAAVEGLTVNATVSIGVAAADDGSTPTPLLLAQADQALYHAKEQGRNRVELASLDLVRERRSAMPQVPAAKAAVDAA